MDQKICLDTDVVIGILNGEERANVLLKDIEESEVFVSVITLFELLLRKTKLEEIEDFRARVGLLDFDEEIARKASAIFKGLKEKGNVPELKDLFIAASCICKGCTLATFNKKDFERIKEYNLILLQS